MTYVEQVWVDEPSTSTPLSADRLNHMEQGIADAHDLLADTTLLVHRLIHDGSDYPTRPASSAVPAGYAEYVGPTEPTDWLDGDTWVERA
jgi:hypothetical protein